MNKQTEKYAAELTNRMDGLKEKTLENAELMQDKLQDLQKKTEDFVKKNPLLSIGIAFGVGILIAKILRSRRHD